ncbi:MAG: hypothetical protein KGQ36_05325 [Rickettsiales bacterium]|nr:hypothetical protein [Rickettsiales bacterium]
MKELNETARQILQEYQERYFNKFFDDFIDSATKQNGEFDYEKSVLAFSILEEIVDCENKEHFDHLLNKVSCNFGEEFFSKHQDHLYALFNRCYIDNFEEELPEEMIRMIGYCVRVSSDSTLDEINESSAQYFKDQSKKYLEHKKHFLMADGKVLGMCEGDVLKSLPAFEIKSAADYVVNSNIPNTVFTPSAESAFVPRKAAIAKIG